ncbi:ABC transporter ATP-binding protein [Burkholderia multivorans]|uniref:ABC transporter ATP-binding protein n=2 Tax=Burkholderia multivorans TaxID=87883 RepID=UPI002018E982|nr:ABC transporter ATP-binding protein [Burkholderia multivorans]UQN53224.1 ABC transporter ATP-binding protein [Burkholderia multivorans]UQO66662.1 ABC transporter ATP-binding protein [Burkholderia multivorans]
MSSDILIRVENVSKVYQIYANPRDRLMQMFWRQRRQLYREFWALRDVSFEVRRGETIGVLGRNGSGKSTLLQIISGTLSPSAGNVQINGKITALLELGAGFNPEFSGRENVYLNASIFGLGVDVIDEKYDEIAAFADIGDFIDQPVKTYSSGMYARLAFAVAISLDPEILVVDEILSVGDVFFQARCMRKLDEFRASGGTVFFVTHDTHAVERICTRGVVLDRGVKVFEGNTADAVNIYYKMSRVEAKDESAVVADRVAEKSDTGVAVAKNGPPTNTAVLGNAVPISVRRDHTVTNGAAFIEEVFFADDIGESRQHFVVGEWITVTLNVRFEVSMEQIDFGVGIRDRVGTLVGGAHSFYSQESFGPVVAGERHLLRARIKLDVQPGEYLMVAGIARHLSLQVYEECYGLYDFCAITVTGDRKFWGGVKLPSEISHVLPNDAEFVR